MATVARAVLAEAVHTEVGLTLREARVLLSVEN